MFTVCNSMEKDEVFCVPLLDHSWGLNFGKTGVTYVLALMVWGIVCVSRILDVHADAG